MRSGYVQPGDIAAVVGTGTLARAVADVSRASGLLRVECIKLEWDNDGRFGPFGPDVVLVCDTNPAATNKAIHLVRPSGTVLLIETPAGPVDIDTNVIVMGDRRIGGVGDPKPEDIDLACRIGNADSWSSEG
tara:strand:+ start:197 stop:592 length:396 start_codon:yes stop_codon:yes gene_type:complete